MVGEGTAVDKTHEKTAAGCRDGQNRIGRSPDYQEGLAARPSPSNRLVGAGSDGTGGRVQEHAFDASDSDQQQVEGKMLRFRFAVRARF